MRLSTLPMRKRLRRHVLIRFLTAESIARLSNLWVMSWPLLIEKRSTTDWSINFLTFGIRWRLGTWGSPQSRRGVDIIRKIVGHAIVHGQQSSHIPWKFLSKV